MEKLLLGFVFLCALALPVAGFNVCNYCEYCQFCGECAKCPCTVSKQTPKCNYCPYCKYCSLCTVCDTVCQEGGIIDSVTSAVSSVLSKLGLSSMDDIKPPADLPPAEELKPGRKKKKPALKDEL